ICRMNHPAASLQTTVDFTRALRTDPDAPRLTDAGGAAADREELVSAGAAGGEFAAATVERLNRCCSLSLAWRARRPGGKSKPVDGWRTALERARALLEDEQGTLFKQAPLRLALCYPSPYAVGMSSLGYQTIYREINLHPGASAERAFLPDDLEEHRRSRA